MCSPKRFTKESVSLQIVYISNLDDFIQHIFALFDYLNDFPVIGDYDDGFDGHIVIFDGMEVLFLGNEM